MGPFGGTKKNDIMRNIIRGKLKWPVAVSDECRDFITGLMKKQPMRRMRIREAKRHPWLKMGVEDEESDDEGDQDDFFHVSTDRTERSERRARSVEILTKPLPGVADRLEELALRLKFERALYRSSDVSRSPPALWRVNEIVDSNDD